MMRTLLAIAALGLSVPAAAEVVQSTPNGFEVKHVVTVNASIMRVWTTAVAPAGWWSPDHTYSGDAKNLTIDARPGGCFCEALPNGGGIEHMRVVYAQPPQMIRMNGALGPLQAEATQGTMAIVLKREGDDTQVTVTYVVGGYVRAGIETLAPLVDKVLGQQVDGLKKAAEAAPTRTEPTR